DDRAICVASCRARTLPRARRPDLVAARRRTPGVARGGGRNLGRAPPPKPTAPRPVRGPHGALPLDAPLIRGRQHGDDRARNHGPRHARGWGARRLTVVCLPGFAQTPAIFAELAPEGAIVPPL